MAGSLRQIEALQELVHHLQQNGQEVPSSIDITSLKKAIAHQDYF
ncbi:MAG: hypothetical protein ACLSH7_06855 [Veillonella parvula]